LPCPVAGWWLLPEQSTFWKRTTLCTWRTALHVCRLLAVILWTSVVDSLLYEGFFNLKITPRGDRYPLGVILTPKGKDPLFAPMFVLRVECVPT
jgi:hypothetical protein